MVKFLIDKLHYICYTKSMLCLQQLSDCPKRLYPGPEALHFPITEASAW